MMNIVDNYDFKHDAVALENYINYLNDKLGNDKEFSLVFIDDDGIKALNSEFRNKDVATDVLSFEEFLDDYLGDIIISIDTMKRQALEYGHSETRELYFLLTHGYLHLNGYDHIKPEEEKIMYELQDKLLQEYGIERV
jgi:probable rRNA maturation factor